MGVKDTAVEGSKLVSVFYKYTGALNHDKDIFLSGNVNAKVSKIDDVQTLHNRCMYAITHK